MNTVKQKDKDYAKIGNRIKEARKMRKLTQAQLAEALDCSNNYISQIERGIDKISLSRLIHVSEILNVDIKELLIDVLPYNYSNNISSSELGKKIDKLSRNKRETLEKIIDVLIEEQERDKKGRSYSPIR